MTGAVPTPVTRPRARVVGAAGLIVATSGALVLVLGHAPAWNGPTLRRWTLLSLVFAGLALAAWPLVAGRAWTCGFARGAGWAAALIGLVSLWLAALGIISVGPELGPAGWVLWEGALVGPLAGLAVVRLATESPGRFDSAPLLGGAAAWLAVVEALALIYGGQMGRLPRGVPVWITAASGVVLGLAVLAAQADRRPVALLASSGPGGIVARRIVPLALVLPPAIGSAIVEARSVGLLGVDMGTALLAGSTALAGVVVVLWRASLLDRDAQERHRAQRTLEVSEERFRGLVENSADGVLLLTPDGTILYQSPSGARLLGFPPGERVGGSPLDIVHPDDRAAVREALARVLTRPGLPATTEFRAWHRDGTWLRLEAVLMNRLDAPALRAVVVNYRDVTARRRTEERLRDSEARVRAILDSALEAVIGMDAEGRVSYWNPRAEAVFGWRQDEILGRTLADLVIPERHRDFHVRGLQRFLATGEGPILGRRVETEALRRDGTEFPVELTVTAVRRDEGVEFNAFLSDVTERRRLEEQLRHSQKLEAVGQLAGGIAHDFNNLLNVIVGYADLLLRQTELPVPRRRPAEQIRKAADRASSLTRQLLAFSRKQVLRPEVLDLNTVVAEMDDMLRRLIGERIELICVPRAVPALVKVDRAQVEQVILNLMVNARDAMPDGGTLVLETASTSLAEDFVWKHPGAAAGRHVILVVSDTGEGMDHRTQARIFEPFFTTKEAGKGTGLGLSTVYGIVSQSGGFVTVYSEPGHGTTFRVYLPETSEPLPPPARVEAFAGRRGAETVLVAEDEPALRELVTEILEEHGYKVLASGGGDEALAAAGVHLGPIHLLVTDVVMPGMAGPELARRLLVTRPQAKCLFLSGYAPEAVTQQGVPAGAHFLVKPFDPDALAHKVRDVLDG